MPIRISRGRWLFRVFTPDDSNAIIVAFKWGYLSRDDINDLAIAKIEQSDGTPPAK